MRITVVETEPLEIPLSRAYAIASGTFDVAQMALVRIRTDQHTGLGSATPGPNVTGETYEACCVGLAPDRLDWLVGRNILDLPALCRELPATLPGAPAARAAVDIALHDLWGRHLGRPVVELLGRAHQTLPTSITIGIKNTAETLEEAEEYVGRGFRFLKVKIGLSLEEDLDRLRQLRARWADAVTIRVDANRGYDPAELTALLDAARELDLELIEQPLPAGAEDALRPMPDAARRSFAADESILSPRDAVALTHPPAPFGIYNIKLMKCGGIHEALRIASIAQAADIDLMWGCMDESVVSIAGALHAAFACPATRYLDLDGSLDLASDPASGGFVLEDGHLRTLDLPGLGVAES